MKHSVSTEDEEFKNRVESCSFPVGQFSHRAHLRLAYIYLARSRNQDTAVRLMRGALTGLLRHAGVDPAVKYHATLTQAWILAVRHFMNHTENAVSADDFIDQHPEMLDPKIMLSHYSPEVLSSEEARRAFVAPNRDPIPLHDDWVP